MSTARGSGATPSVSGQKVSAPIEIGDTATAKKTFEHLCAEFQIHVSVGIHMVDTIGLETLVDFRKLGKDGELVAEKCVKDLKEMPFPERQRSRLIQAWEAVGSALDKADGLKRKSESNEDADAPLDEDDKGKIEDFFWGRHRLKFVLRLNQRASSLQDFSGSWHRGT